MSRDGLVTPIAKPVAAMATASIDSGSTPVAITIMSSAASRTPQTATRVWWRTRSARKPPASRPEALPMRKAVRAPVASVRGAAYIISNAGTANVWIPVKAPDSRAK